MEGIKTVNRKFIISGGPGAGKSTLVQALEHAGFCVFHEQSRKVIKKEVALQSECLPWKNFFCFQKKVLAEMLKDYRASDGLSGDIFFDRGVPDVIAYSRLANLALDHVIIDLQTRCRYEATVFLAPPWKEIYVRDPERWQSFSEAELIYTIILDTYTSLGYLVIPLPKIDTPERVQFVLGKL